MHGLAVRRAHNRPLSELSPNVTGTGGFGMYTVGQWQLQKLNWIPS